MKHQAAQKRWMVFMMENPVENLDGFHDGNMSEKIENDDFFGFSPMIWKPPYQWMG